MKPMACLILFGCIGVILMQLFRPSPEKRVAIMLPLSLGFLFYCASSFIAFCLMIAWVLTVYAVARKAAASNQQKYLPWIYIFVVVGIFAAFKLGLFPVMEKGSLMDNAMPIGFSFIMFHSIAVILDQSRAAPGRPIPISEYTASALFFPTLAIGPFHKFQVFKKSLDAAWEGDRLFEGYCLVCLGAFKLGISGILLKPYFLRGMPLLYDPDVHYYHPAVLLLLASTFLFANFSGYSDLVVGFAKMMGFDVPPNFRFPFLARSMAQYWRNWHISLGAWFKEFVFLPLHYKLASNRILPLSHAGTAALSVFVTFFLIGIWHEFSFKILIYALINSALVAFFFPNNKNPWIGIPATFIFALLINGIFLARDLAIFESLLSNMFRPPAPEAFQINVVTTALAFLVLALFFGAEKLVEQLSVQEKNQRPWVVSANFVLCIVELFVGITLGIGRTDTVYIGY